MTDQLIGVKVRENLQEVHLGPVRLIRGWTQGSHVGVALRGMPEGSGPLLGNVVMDEGEWTGMVAAARAIIDSFHAVKDAVTEIADA